MIFMLLNDSNDNMERFLEISKKDKGDYILIVYFIKVGESAFLICLSTQDGIENLDPENGFDSYINVLPCNRYDTGLKTIKIMSFYCLI